MHAQASARPSAAFDDDPFLTPSSNVVFSDPPPPPPPKPPTPKTPYLRFPGEGAPPATKAIQNHGLTGSGINLVEISRLAGATTPAAIPDFERYGRAGTTYARVWLACTNPQWATRNPAQLADLCGISVGRFRAIRNRMQDKIAAFWQGGLVEGHAWFNEALIGSMMIPGREGASDRKLFAQLTGRLADPRLLELKRAEAANADQQRGLGDVLIDALNRARKQRDPQHVVIDLPSETVAPTDPGQDPDPVE